MSIERTSSALAGLLEQLPVSNASATSSVSTESSSFQKLLNSDQAAVSDSTEAPMAAPSIPDRSAAPSTPAAPATISMDRSSSISTRADSTTGRDASTTTANPSAGTTAQTGDPAARIDPPPAFPPEPLDPSPAAPWPTTAIQIYPLPELATQAKSAVYAAMEEQGVDSSGVKISYWEELVMFPGGNYTNKNITVQAANGRKIDLDAAYMLRCPWLAASAVQDLSQVVT